jgi:hypothetical protein
MKLKGLLLSILNFILIIKCVSSQIDKNDVCYNDDIDPITNMTRKTVPYSNEQITELMANLTSISKLLVEIEE